LASTPPLVRIVVEQRVELQVQVRPNGGTPPAATGETPGLSSPTGRFRRDDEA